MMKKKVKVYKSERVNALDSQQIKQVQMQIVSEKRFRTLTLRSSVTSNSLCDFSNALPHTKMYTFFSKFRHFLKWMMMLSCHTRQGACNIMVAQFELMTLQQTTVWHDT